MRRRVPWILFTLVGFVGCSSVETGKSIVAVTTTLPPTTPTTTTEPATTVTVTTIVDTTAPPTTTPSSVPAGWHTIDPATVTGQWNFPCCASNWYGTPSPPLPSPGAALPANAIYGAHMQWGPDPSAPLQLQLYRFEQCNVLPAGSCEDGSAVGTWEPDEMGGEPGEPYLLTVPLDDRVRIVLTGFAGFDDNGVPASMAEGNGTDLAALAVAVDAAHADVLMSRLASGMTQQEIVDEISANPEGGFVASLEGNGYGLSYIYDGAPPLLFQGAFDFEDPASSRGTDVLLVPSVQTIDGVLTVYVYAGYYS